MKTCMYFLNYYNYYILDYRKRLAIVFTPLLEQELRQFKAHWNSHRIRESRHADCPGGIPDDLYDMPVHYGKHVIQSGL